MVIAVLTHGFAHINEVLEIMLPTLCADFTSRNLSAIGYHERATIRVVSQV